jgi:CRP-like cAMP-binding protein
MIEGIAEFGIGQYDDPGITQSADRSLPSGGLANAVRLSARGLILDRFLASAFDAAECFMVFRRGCTLFPEWGQRGAWLVLAGSFKEIASWDSRGEKIVDLVLPGTVLLAGWNAMHAPHSSVRAVALEDSVSVPVGATTTLYGTSAPTQFLAAKLARSLRLRAMLQWPVDARVAQFLVDFAAHCRVDGAGDDELRLPLKGGEIANLLSMRHEIFSRSLRRLKEQGVIERDRQCIRILDHSGLARSVEGARQVRSRNRR